MQTDFDKVFEMAEQDLERVRALSKKTEAASEVRSAALGRLFVEKQVVDQAWAEWSSSLP